MLILMAIFTWFIQYFTSYFLFFSYFELRTGQPNESIELVNRATQSNRLQRRIARALGNARAPVLQREPEPSPRYDNRISQNEPPDCVLKLSSPVWPTTYIYLALVQKYLLEFAIKLFMLILMAIFTWFIQYVASYFYIFIFLTSN